MSEREEKIRWIEIFVHSEFSSLGREYDSTVAHNCMFGSVCDEHETLNATIDYLVDWLNGLREGTR